jgi:chromosome segregation protein
VVAVEQRRAATIRQQALRDADEQLRIGAATRLADADVAWHALWQPCGLVPADPTSMREWMQKRTGVLAEHRRSLDAERRLDAVRGRHAVGLAMLAAVMRGTVQAPGTALTTVLRSAEHVCREREKQEDRLAKAGDAVEAALQEQTKAVRVTARLEADLTAWRESWGPAAQSMSLPADASPDLGATALGLWEAIDKAGRARRDAMDRIDEMTAAIDRFAAETRSVVGRVAPGLAGISPLDAVSSLGRDLADARERARRRQEVEAERGRVVTAIEGLERQRNAALDVLVRLCAQAGAMDDDGLAEMIGRWSRHRALAEQIAQRRAELQGLDDGKGLPELTAEADGIDFDTLPARISAIESELRSINVEELQNQERMAGLKQVLGEMERGRDAAAAAQDMETALADIDDISGRYVTLRMAHVLLRAGIERFRRQQQGPLLGRAGQIFARLTEGRYDRLGVDEQEDGKVVVAACRPDGTECQADRLSEGTRDQLYLALRLAALESDARATEPLPFIGDDLLVNFDDRRAKATIRVLADFASVTQVVLFTHHGHIAQMAEGLGSVHPLAVDVAVL